ncbi:aminotransferase class I/II-fold pyridoxal phosphate-dependent enzyme [archaeon]|nr:MAG: aminotransferase class I/II-fold pyridoxal phosphate-dependent enzyme [archaeon]
MTTFFENLPEEPPNSILGLALECKNDPFPGKINLTIGAYRDNTGEPIVLPCVREAEEALLGKHLDHEYLVQDGLADFDRCAQLLMFGEDSQAIQEKRVYTIQAVAGTAAVRLGADFIHRVVPGGQLLMPDVTWPNHPTICKAVGISFSTYRYLDSTGVGFDFEGMLADLKAAPEHSVVLFHSCAHNPTGIDPNEEQWRTILSVVQTRHLLPFFDNAYQGFVSGDPIKDAFAVRLFAAAGLELLVACSFSKNFGLYGERTGALHIVLKDDKEVPRAASIARALARPLYSTCPSYGARIVAHVLSNPARNAQWQRECAEMAHRLNHTRQLLYDTLVQKNVKGTWEHIVQQKGMFSFSGIPGHAVQRLKTEHHIYLLMDGRISLAGLNTGNVERFANALAEVLGTN